MLHSLIYDGGNNFVEVYTAPFQAVIKTLKLLYSNSTKTKYRIEVYQKNNLIDTILVSKVGYMVNYQSTTHRFSKHCNCFTNAVNDLAAALNTDIDGYFSYYGNLTLEDKLKNIKYYELAFMTPNIKKELVSRYSDSKTRFKFSQFLKSIEAEEVTSISDKLNVAIEFSDGTIFRFSI